MHARACLSRACIAGVQLGSSLAQHFKHSANALRQHTWHNALCWHLQYVWFHAVLFVRFDSQHITRPNDLDRWERFWAKAVQLSRQSGRRQAAAYVSWRAYLAATSAWLLCRHERILLPLSMAHRRVIPELHKPDLQQHTGERQDARLHACCRQPLCDICHLKQL